MFVFHKNQLSVLMLCLSFTHNPFNANLRETNKKKTKHPPGSSVLRFAQARKTLAFFGALFHSMMLTRYEQTKNTKSVPGGLQDIPLIPSCRYSET